MRRGTRRQLAAPPSRLALALAELGALETAQANPAEHCARDRRPAAPHPCPDPGTTPPGGAATSAYARTPPQLQVPARPATPRAGGRWNAQAGRCLPLLAPRFSELIF